MMSEVNTLNRANRRLQANKESPDDSQGTSGVETQTERIVEVPVERIVEVPKDKIVEIPVEKIVEIPIDRVVEKLIEVPKTENPGFHPSCWLLS